MSEEKPQVEGEVPAEGEEQIEEEVLTPACIDLTDYKLKIDHFDQMHVLGDDKVEGAQNFRQVAGFPVFGTAQPTEEGFVKVMEKLPKGTEEKPITTLWYNMRQEPVIYVNGIPYAPRNPEKMHENLELQESTSELANLQKHFANIVQARADADGGNLKIHKDSTFTENPMEREDVESSVKAESIKGLHTVYDGLTGEESGFGPLITFRVPVVEERAPPEQCFDILVESLKEEPAATQCVFSCQMGRGRTTIGMIIACLVKEIQISTELRRMGDLAWCLRTLLMTSSNKSLRLLFPGPRMTRTPSSRVSLM